MLHHHENKHRLVFNSSLYLIIPFNLLLFSIEFLFLNL